MQEIGITKTQKPFQRIAVVALGSALMLGGIIGLFLPVVPGDLLIGVGVLMLSTQYAWLRQAVEKCRARVPFVRRTLTRLSACWETCRRRFTNPGDPGSQLGV